MQGRVFGLEGGVARGDGNRAQGRRALRVRRIAPKHACELEPQPRQADKRLLLLPTLYRTAHDGIRVRPTQPSSLDKQSLTPLLSPVPRPTGPTTSTRLASSLSFLLVPAPAQLSNPSPFEPLPQRPSPPGPRRPDRTGSSPLSSGSLTTTERRSRCESPLPPLLLSSCFLSLALARFLCGGPFLRRVTGRALDAGRSWGLLRSRMSLEG